MKAFLFVASCMFAGFALLTYGVVDETAGPAWWIAGVGVLVTGAVVAFVADATRGRR